MTNVAVGTANPQTTDAPFNALSFLVQSILAGVNTCTVVQVIACTNAGDLSPVGTVDVQPLVNQMTGDRKPVPHGTIYKLPYSRMQGGTNAIILDPVAGDLGIVVFAQRDISAVKTAKAAANPGSFRQFDWADGIYVGGILNGTPANYIQFDTAGITLNGTPTVLINGIDFMTHIHTGGTISGSTGPPVPGS